MTDSDSKSRATTAAPRRARVLVQRVLPALISLEIVVLVFWYLLPQFTSISDVWAAIRSMTSLELVTLGIAALWNLATYLFVMVGTMPGLSYPAGRRRH